MRVIICGAGRVGTGIASQLAAEGNEVTVIDNNPATLTRISTNLDVKTVHGYACHPPVLEEAGAEDAEMLIAVTTSDEVNMIACQIAKTIFQVPTKIARIRHQNYLLPVYRDLYRNDDMPVDVIISPEIEVGRNILQRFHVPGATDTFAIENSDLKVVSVRLLPDCPVLGVSISSLYDRLSRLNISIVGIWREGKMHLPKPKDVLQEDDEIYFVTDNKSLDGSMVALGHEEKEARRIIIIGGGNIGYFLASELEQEDSKTRIKIIELDRERAEKIADMLERTMIINGSALEEDILEEVNMQAAETVICVTNDDEVNILSSILAKNMGVNTTFALLNNHSFVPLMKNLGVDVTVNPRETTVSSILQHVRKGKIRSAHTIKEGAAEIIEAEVVESIGMTNRRLSELDLPKNVIIGAVCRNGEFIHPEGNLQLRRRDRLILLSLTKHIKEVEEMFSMQSAYF